MAINVIGCQEVSYFSSLFRLTNLIISPYDPYLIQISEAMWDLSFFILLTIQMTSRLNLWPQVRLRTHSLVKSNRTNKNHDRPLWSTMDQWWKIIYFSEIGHFWYFIFYIVHVKVLTNTIPMMYVMYHLVKHVRRYLDFSFLSWWSKSRSFVDVGGRIDFWLR